MKLLIRFLSAISLKGLFLALYPLLSFAIVGWFLISHPIVYAKDLLDLFLCTAVGYAAAFLIPFGVVRLIWLMLTSFLLYVFAYFKLSFFYLFQSKVTVSAFYILFETNQKETSGFLQTYFDVTIVFFTLITIGLLLIFYRFLIKSHKKNTLQIPLPDTWPSRIFLTIILTGGILSSIYMIQLKFRENNLYFLSKEAYLSYLQMQELFNSELTRVLNDNIGQVKANDDPQTYIIIIGESTSAKHMSLYGYYRKTNPLLEEIKNELHIFNDVIAPETHTIPSLNKVLTFSNYEDPEALEQGTIIQLANAAGFSTYWISNQPPIGVHETLITAMSKATKEQFFVNVSTDQHFVLDDEVLAPLHNVLKKPEPKKIIFLHLMGTHVPYKFRYSDSYKKFTDTPKTPFPSAFSTEQINQYDNAMLYNDFVIRSVIEETRKNTDIACIVYFADHGDEVFYDIDFVGHSGYHSSPSMHHVPFILWTSESFRSYHPISDSLVKYTDRRYMLDDFIHTFADLLQIKSKKIDPERSIIHPKFKPRKRIIHRRIDYDNR